MTFPSKGGPVQSDFEGLVLKFNRLYIQRDSSELSERTLNHVKILLRMAHAVMQGDAAQSIGIKSLDQRL